MQTSDEIAAEILSEVAGIESAFVASLKIRDIIKDRGLGEDIHDLTMQRYDENGKRPSVWNDNPAVEKPSLLCPEPGIYEDVPFGDYCDWDAVNHSKLSRIDKSPLHSQVAPNFEKSQAIRLGQLVHTGRLEPDSVASRYAVMPAFELLTENTTKNGQQSTSTATEFVKDKRQEFMASMIAEQKTVINEAEYQALQNALDAITACPEAVEKLTGGRPELSIVWHDRRTGLRCKARIDYQRPDALTDLKTSRDDGPSPLPMSFEYSLWTYNYYTQAAWYQSGWEELTGERLPFWFAVVGTNSPMQCVCAPVGEMTLNQGRAKNIERMALYKQCHDANSFPGYESPELFELPEKYLPEEITL